MQPFPSIQHAFENVPDADHPLDEAHLFVVARREDPAGVDGVSLADAIGHARDAAVASLVADGFEGAGILTADGTSDAEGSGLLDGDGNPVAA